MGAATAARTPGGSLLQSPGRWLKSPHSQSCPQHSLSWDLISLRSLGKSHYSVGAKGNVPRYKLVMSLLKAEKREHPYLVDGMLPDS